ncbi:NAD-dependent epimerase/dehydratase family protein [Verrucomicrobiota bacterium]
MNSIVRQDCENALAGKTDLLKVLRNESVLVTGGTGFFGTWLAEMIASLNDKHNFGCRLVLMARRPHVFSEKVPHLAKRTDITLVGQDARMLIELPPETSYVIHAAASPDSRLHASDPLQTIDVIVNGTNAVLTAATRLPALKKILLVSSGLVYGPQPWELDGIPESFTGSVDCSAAISAYVEAKRMAETIAAAYRSQHRLPITTVRPFAFIGPYQLMDRPWAVNNFIRDGLRGGPIRILGDGTSVRSYMYPSDMSFWLLRILADGIPGQSYNLGNPEGITLKKLAEKISGCFPKSIDIECRNLTNEVTRHSRLVPDISLAKDTLGLTIGVDLDAAIRRTILWNQSTKVPAQNELVDDRV